MAEHRPFPPSPRRRALAQHAGLHAASPMLVGGVVAGAAVIALGALGAAAARHAGGWITAAVRGDATALAPGHVLGAVLELATPLLAACAIVAVVAHVAQTRTPWIPRRSLPGAPAVDRGPAARVRRAMFELAAGATVGAVAVGWLWLLAPRLAALPGVPLAGAALVASALAALAIAWVALGACEALLRHRELAGALQMSAHDKREDERLAGADPRWRAYRAGLRRPQPTDPARAVAGATLLVLGDDVAVVIAWDPVHRPIPTRTAVGRGPRATQLLGLARRHGLPVHRDHPLAAALVERTGPLPERHWPRVAEIVAARRAH